MSGKIVCDFCGRIIGANYYQVRVKARRRRYGFFGDAWYDRCDLCDDCKEEIVASVQARIYAEPPRETS